MKKKLLKSLFIISLLLLLGSAAYIAVDKASVYKSVLGMNGESFIALNRQSAQASVMKPEKNSSIYLVFTTNQRTHLLHRIRREGGISIQARVKLLSIAGRKPAGDTFEFGLLYERGAAATGNEAPSDLAPGRNLVTGSFSELPEGTTSFMLSICLADAEKMPAGFFMHGLKPYQITSVSFGDMQLGWDKSSPVPLYAFGADGGSLADFADGGADFSTAAALFPSENAKGSVLPQISVGLVPASAVGTWDNQATLGFSYGDEKLSVRRAKQQLGFTLQLSAVKTPYTALRCSEPEAVTRMLLSANSPALAADKDARVLYPFVTDLGLVFEWPRGNWRTADYELYEWELVPHVLFFDFANYKVQNEFLTRLAYFVEKKGYKGTLVSDEFVATQHGYNAHDYKAADLAAFFSTAAKQQFPLNARELLLRDILLANKIITENTDGSYAGGEGALISISRESADYLRRTLLAHESWHGIFFTNEAFRSEVSRLYDGFDRKSLDFLRIYFATQPGLNYDTDDDYLMRNEFMAYIIQQPVSAIAKYYQDRANWNSVLRNEPEEAAHVRSTAASAFVEAGLALNDYVFDNFGLAAGRVHLISR